MKKILFAAMAALAITSCSQNEEIEAPAQKTPMEFNGVVGKTARATVEDLTSLKNHNTGFKVYAYNVGAAGTASTEKSIIINEAIKYTDSKWKSNTTYYWPAEDKVMFYAYFSPKGKVSSLTPNADKTHPTIDQYSVPTTVTDQEDLLVSKVGPTDKTTSTTVDFKFEHALAQINFSIKSKNNDGLTYVVKKITLTKVGSVATYDYNAGWGTTATPIAYEYPLSNTVNDNTVAGDGTTTKTLDTTTKLMLLPQVLDADATITIAYQVLDNNDNIVYEAKEAAPKVVAIGTEAEAVNKTWTAGKKVRYTLALTNDATEIGWEVSEPTSWNTGDDNAAEKDTVTPAA